MSSASDPLKELLFDMGRYLSDSLAGENLTPASEEKRIGLLQRLEPHIRSIPRTDVCSAPNTPPPYLDMNGPKVGREEYVDAEVNGDKIEEEYEEFPEVTPPPLPSKVAIESRASSSSSSGQSEDYVNLSLPYSELQTMTNKCGPLWRKEKFIFLDQWRRYWAGIYGHVVLIYGSERDTKPTTSLDLQGFEARPLSNVNHKDPKKKDAVFEVVCPGKKTHQFIARTAKDMTQWVAAICLAGTQPSSTPVPHHLFFKSSQVTRRQLPSLPDSGNETYDDVGSKYDDSGQENYEPVQSEEEEEIYHDIAEVYQRATEDNKTVNQEESGEQPPVLPKRPVPSIPQEDFSDHDSVYDDVGISSPNNMYSNMTEFIENEKQAIQQSLQVSESVNVNALAEHIEEEDIYDDVGLSEKVQETVTLPSFRRESSSGSGGRIQNIIKKMEESFGNGARSIVGAKSKAEVSKQSQSEELYEPIDGESSETPSLIPQLPPRTNLVRT